jgi:conjugative relaxase-like TrwC/TraI family protein
VHSGASERRLVVTVRVTTLKGADAGAYYVEQLPNYYLQSGEPRGLWHGEGAGMLGLRDEVEDEHFLAVMAGMDPVRPDRHLGRRYDDTSVRGFDVTASAPKSVSLMFALGDDEVRRAVLDAHDTAVQTVTKWIEDHAHTRYRIGGEVAVVDATGIVAAAFRQHTSRALDPQLHTHLVIANRVKSPDGRWLALDARLIKHDQQTLSALYHVSLRSELTASLGVRWNTPERGIAEIADMPEALLVEFSTRTGAVARRIEEKLDRFIATMDRDPTPRERWKLEREAAIDSRPAKVKAVDAASLHQAWAEQAAAIGFDPPTVVANTIGHVVGQDDINPHETARIAHAAMKAMAEKQSTWRPTELQREFAAEVPTDTTLPARELVAWLDDVADYVTRNHCVDISKPVPAGALLRKDGRPVTESVVDRALTTQAILDQEAALVTWADRRLRYVGVDNPAAINQAGVDLNIAQADAAAAVAGTDDLVLVVGPAGTGKTTALAPAVAQLRVEGRVVFGVALSATAADVLQYETGVVADTVDKLLIEHRLQRPPDHRYDLPIGATVLVAEAGMISTTKLSELADLADVKGWRVALVGDPLQFSAVGRGGMFGMLVDIFGAIELERVHRFEHAWERDATLRMRRGDVTVVDDYEVNDRLHGGTTGQMERAAVRRWWEHRTNGDTVLLMAPNNEAVERLNHRCQQQRINAGDIDDAAPHVVAGAYRIRCRDEITTRHNDRRLVTDRGEMIRNRATWTVEHVHPDRSLTVTGQHGTVRLPASYVAEHVELAYACTDHGAQGRTVTAGVLFIDRPTDVRNVYVAMSRGTTSNEVFIAITGEQSAADVFAQCIASDWIDQPAHIRQAEINDTMLHRPGLLDGAEVRRLLAEKFDIIGFIERAEATVARYPKELQTAERARDAAEKSIGELVSAESAAAAVVARWDRPLHRRRHEVEIVDAKRDLQQLPSRITGAEGQRDAADARIEDLMARRSSAIELLADRPAVESQIAEIDEQLGDDLRVRTRVGRVQQPEAIVAVLGERPLPGADARDWDDAAGLLLQHQAAFDIADGIGHYPGSRAGRAYIESYARVAEVVALYEPAPLAAEVEIGHFGMEL